MKKLLIFTCSLLLVLACQKGVNDLVVDDDLIMGTGASNLPRVYAITPTNGNILPDHDTASGIQGQIEITFTDFMDEATLVTSNIQIWNTTTNSQVTAGITTEYFSDIRKLYIYIANIPSNSPYLLKLLASGIKNKYGSPLDYDQDNNAEGSPYDDYLSTFYTLGNTDTLVDITQAGILAINPDVQLIGNQRPLITVAFNSPLDTLTLIAANFALNNSAGTAQPIKDTLRNTMTVSLISIGNLPYDNYTFRIKSANIKQLCKSTTPDYIKILDGDDDGPEAAEPDTGTYFRVDTVLPPTVDAADLGATGAIFTFSRLIDQTTLDLTTIRVFDDNGYLPGVLRIYTNFANTQTLVEYYYQRTAAGNPDAFVSKTVKDKNKPTYTLDGNGNGICGESDDDDWEYNF